MRNYLKKFLCSKKAKLDTSRVASAGEEMVVECRGQRDSRNGVGRRITHKVLVEKNLRENKQTIQDDTSGSRVGLRIWFFLQQRKRLRVQIPDRPSGKKVYIKNDLNCEWVIHGSKRSAGWSAALPVCMSKFWTPHSSWWLSVCEWVSIEVLLQVKA